MERKISRIVWAGILLLAVACGPRRAKAPASPAARPFPAVEIPALITEPQERIQYASLHFWDRFLSLAAPSDTLSFFGIAKKDVEEQMGIFVTLLQQAPAAVGQEAMLAFMDGLEDAQRKAPKGHILADMAGMTHHYLYDPTSPVRSEELYLPFVSRLAGSALVDPSLKTGYAWDARMCALNRPGTPAADFTFVDTRGRTRTLYGIQAGYILLIFGNPDCHACKELMEQMSTLPEVDALIESGRLKVLDIYIDEDIDLWKQKAADYPAAWINGYDPGFIIRTDLLYNVRALPSLYLLDKDKTVLLKDAETAQVLDSLAALEQVQ